MIVSPLIKGLRLYRTVSSSLIFLNCNMISPFPAHSVHGVDPEFSVATDRENIADLHGMQKEFQSLHDGRSAGPAESTVPLFLGSDVSQMP